MTSRDQDREMAEMVRRLWDAEMDAAEARALLRRKARHSGAGFYTRTGRYRRLPRDHRSQIRVLWRAMSAAQRNLVRAIALLWLAFLLDAAGLWLAAGAAGLIGSLTLTLALVGPNGVFRRDH